jgi:phosphoglycolate phosphatase
MNRLAVFDCDGTLVDSQATICLAMDRCFEAAGLTPPTHRETRRIVGLSLVEAMEALLPEAEATLIHALAADYKHQFQALRGHGLVDEPLFPQIAETLDALESAGWLLGVATGKSDRGLAMCLAHHGLDRRFVTLQTADRHPSKPHPAMLEAAMAEAGAAPGSTLMIGDTSFDMRMAGAAGARAIGVSWGYHGPEELRAAGAEVVIDAAGALIALLEETA